MKIFLYLKIILWTYSMYVCMYVCIQIQYIFSIRHLNIFRMTIFIFEIKNYIFKIIHFFYLHHPNILLNKIKIFLYLKIILWTYSMYVFMYVCMYIYIQLQYIFSIGHLNILTMTILIFEMINYILKNHTFFLFISTLCTVKIQR